MKVESFGEIEYWKKVGSHRAIESWAYRQNSVISFCCEIDLSYIEKKRYCCVDNLSGLFNLFSGLENTKNLHTSYEKWFPVDFVRILRFFVVYVTLNKIKSQWAQLSRSYSLACRERWQLIIFRIFLQKWSYLQLSLNWIVHAILFR